MIKFDARKFDQFGTPFYFYDIDLLRETIMEAKRNADKYGYKLHYAIKANSEPRILQEISSAGLGADCVSGWEIKRSIECGFNPDDIVFAGVGKSDDEIRYAVDHDIFLFNVESIEEIYVISKIAAETGKKINISFRINPNISPATHKYISTGHSDSKFGISMSEIPLAIQTVKQLDNIQLSSIHMHIGSQILDMNFFKEQAIVASEIISDLHNQYGLDITDLDLGGGLGIDYEKPEQNQIPDFEGYFSAFYNNLNIPKKIAVHFELGRAIVAQSGELIARVLFNKKTSSGKEYIIIDAGMTDLIRPALYGAHHNIKNLTSTSNQLSTYSVGGPICESSDIFATDIQLPISKRGDLISIQSAGAYGAIMSSNYNLRPTAKAVYSDEL